MPQRLYVNMRKNEMYEMNFKKTIMLPAKT